MIHATPACSNISDAAFFDLFFLIFFPNTRNTRGVTKGFLVGEHQQSHYAKYEYPPDDSIHTRSARGSAYMVHGEKTEDAESLARLKQHQPT